MKKKILITPKSFHTWSERAVGLLEEYGFELIVNETGKTLTEEQMVALCHDVDGVILGIDPMNERVLRNAKKLKAISRYGAGMDNIDMKTADELGIKVERAAGTNTLSVAELSFGMFFALSRNIVKMACEVKNGSWERSAGFEITGKTAGIIGLGAIGREVARLCQGTGMNVIAYDPYVKDTLYAQNRGINMVQIEHLLSHSDFVTLHLPLTPETKNLINKDTLKLMRQTAYLVNTSRGGLIDEDALYEALAGGKIAGAAADVFSKEPPGEHKLLTLDNFILTPHIGAFTEEATERAAVKSIENLVNMLF